jgi:cleavage stimulation factor subunit 3
MADNAELAHGQQEYDPAMSFEAAGDDEEYDPASTYSPQAPSEQSASMPPESAGNSPPAADGEGESNGLQPPSAEISAAPTPSKQPRTRGGFVDESEDEEEEPVAQPKPAAPALLNASGPAESPQPSFTNTPNNTLPTPDVQLHSAQDQGALSLLSASVAVNESVPSIASTAGVPNGSTPVPDVTMTGAPHLLNVVSARQSTAPATPVPNSSALPKARLPQDRIGILEDRVAEDPRGDIEAWLSLIEEHRRRHKNDEARAAFERFLKVFPTAVSCTECVSRDLANVSRVSNGSSSLRSRPSSTSCTGSSSCSASRLRWRPMFRCTLRTLTLFVAAST